EVHELGRRDFVARDEAARLELEHVEPARDLGAVDVAVVPVRRPRAAAHRLRPVHRAAVEECNLLRMRRIGPVEHREPALIPRLHHHGAAGDRNHRAVVRDAVLVRGLRRQHRVIALERHPANGLSTMPCRFVRRAVLSAPVAVPVPPRALTILSSSGVTKRGPTTCSIPKRVTVKPPCARAESAARWASAMSCGISLWVGAWVSESKIRGELTIAAVCGAASGTLMTSILNSALFGFESGDCFTHPGSSEGERTGADP